jgi:hypothetical protein
MAFILCCHIIPFLEDHVKEVAVMVVIAVFIDSACILVILTEVSCGFPPGKCWGNTLN